MHMRGLKNISLPRCLRQLQTLKQAGEFFASFKPNRKILEKQKKLYCCSLCGISQLGFSCSIIHDDATSSLSQLKRSSHHCRLIQG
jgi:hypothetical protein